MPYAWIPNLNMWVFWGFIDKDFSRNFPTAPEHSDITTWTKKHTLSNSLIALPLHQVEIEMMLIPIGGGGRGVGYTTYQKTGWLVKKGLKESIKGTKILFGGRYLKVFLPLSCTNSKATDNLLSYFFRLNIPKRYRKSSHCGPFQTQNPMKYQDNLARRVSHLPAAPGGEKLRDPGNEVGTKTTFSTPETYGEHPRAFPIPPYQHSQLSPFTAENNFKTLFNK